jgi:hypothetical protein
LAVRGEADEHVRNAVLGDRAMGVAVPADDRDLGHDALDALVDRANDQDVSAGVAGAPDPDPAAVDLGQAAGVGDRVAVVADLPPGVDLLAGRPIAVAEVAVVIDNDA